MQPCVSHTLRYFDFGAPVYRRVGIASDSFGTIRIIHALHLHVGKIVEREEKRRRPMAADGKSAIFLKPTALGGLVATAAALRDAARRKRRRRKWRGRWGGRKVMTYATNGKL